MIACCFTVNLYIDTEVLDILSKTLLCHVPHLGQSAGGHDTVPSSPPLRIKRVSYPPPHYLTQVNTCVISPTVCLTFRTFSAILKQAKKRWVWGAAAPQQPVA